MVLRLAGATALMLAMVGPAFAVGPNCGDQIAALKGQLHDNAKARASLGSKVEQADQLCKQNKDQEAQNMARQIREEMSQTSGKGASGSSTSSGTNR
ncbi:MAG TPA: hypothetical protein VF113_00690 [Stellaceae bacterium]